MTADQKNRFKRAGIGISKAILIALGALSFGAAMAIAPGGVDAVMRLVGKLIDDYEGKGVANYHEYQIKAALRYLKSRKLIDIQRQYQKDVFTLTKLGRLRVRKLLKSFGIRKPKKWDGKWRMIIFDIPHTKKSESDIFRQRLKNLGLANLQKSIWIHPFDCKDQIYYLAGNLFITPYVRYIVAEEVTGEADLRKRFELF